MIINNKDEINKREKNHDNESASRIYRNSSYKLVTKFYILIPISWQPGDVNLCHLNLDHVIEQNNINGLYFLNLFSRNFLTN